MWLGLNLACAMHLIVHALEKKDSNSSEGIWLLEMNVPAAAQWFIYASGVILRSGMNVDKMWFRGSETWKGKEWFSKKRWEVWKGQLGKMKDMEVLSEETREYVRRASVAVGKAERANN
jgi:hypothetical protein